MKINRSVKYFVVAGLAIVLMSLWAIAEETQSSTSDTATGTASTPQAASPGTFMSFKNYPDQVFNAKEYTKGMEKSGHNLLIWRDPSANLSKYSSVKAAEFGGRLLPQQAGFSYDTYIALFNSIFRTSLKLPQQDTPEALLIEGALVECNPGSRTARYVVGFGAGKSGGAVVCEVFEPGNPSPFIRIYTRDSGSLGTFGGNSAAMLNHIFNALAIRVADKLNTTVTIK